jgi:hypothetical protein
MAKSKRSKRHDLPVDNLGEAFARYGEPSPPAQPAEPAVPQENPAPRPLPLSLADIRTEALRAHSNTAHTIADLEAWAAEIASTIAFLKARGR